VIIEMSDKSFIDKAKDTMEDVIDKAKDTMEDVTEKASDTMGKVTKFQKQSKLKAGYIERDEFKNSNFQKGFFCYNCIYWINMTGGKCMMVNDKGPDLFGNVSDVISPHGCCSVYTPDFDEINKLKEVIVEDNK
jgi:hypothetical protein